MSPRSTAMRPHLPSLVLLLAVAATAPLVPAVCISRFEKAEIKSEASAATGGSVRKLSQDDEYVVPKMIVQKPRQVNPFQEATPAKASTSYDKPVEAAEAAASTSTPDQNEESSASNKVKKEKSEDSDGSAAYAKEDKPDDSDVSSSLKKEKKEKKENKKSDDMDESISTKKKKQKKEKSDDSDDESSSSKKKKKKQKKSDDDDASSSTKKEKKDKSDDSDKDSSSTKKKEKKEKKEKAKKKKEKSSDKQGEDEENPDEDAAPVDVSASGQYISSPKAVSGGSTKSSTTSADAYASPDEQQPMGGAPDELPPAAKKPAITTDAYASPDEQPMGGAPDELPPSSAKSSGAGAAADAYASPTAGPAAKQPKMSMGGMVKRPIAKMLSPVTKSVCAGTTYPADCEASIAELPAGGGGGAADAIGVLRLAMEAVRQKAVEAMNAATDRMNAPGTDATTKEALDTCTSSYSDIRTSLETVDGALKRGDLDTARTNLDSVETDVTTCDDGFAELGTPSVMKDHDQELQKLASDLIAIGANTFHH